LKKKKDSEKEKKKTAQISTPVSMWKPLLSGLVAGRRYDLARAITLGKPSGWD